jgi:hypothetical protein
MFIFNTAFWLLYRVEKEAFNMTDQLKMVIITQNEYTDYCYVPC